MSYSVRSRLKLIVNHFVVRVLLMRQVIDAGLVLVVINVDLGKSSIILTKLLVALFLLQTMHNLLLL